MSSQRILSPLQQELLGRLSRSEFSRSFFLTGGTALAACYLQHRLSEDLDFFTDEEGRVEAGVRQVEACARELKAGFRVTRTYATFAECFLDHADGPLKVHLAQDAPARIMPVRRDHAIGFPVDHEMDIACNKISALFDRSAERDYVDVYFIQKELFPLATVLAELPKKHVGVEPYWLAQAFGRARTIELLPRMLKPLALEELKAFFLDEAKRLMDSLQGGR